MMRAVGWSLSHCFLLAGSHAVDKGAPSRLMHCRSLLTARRPAHCPPSHCTQGRGGGSRQGRGLTLLRSLELLGSSRQGSRRGTRSRQAALSPRAGAGGARGGGAGRGLSRRRGQEEEEAEEEGARPPGTGTGSRTAPGTCTAEARGGGAHGGGLRMHRTRSSPTAAPPQPHRSPTAATPHVHCPAHAAAPHTDRACPAPGELVALTLTLTLARR